MTELPLRTAFSQSLSFGSMPLPRRLLPRQCLPLPPHQFQRPPQFPLQPLLQPQPPHPSLPLRRPLNPPRCLLLLPRLNQLPLQSLLPLGLVSLSLEGLLSIQSHLLVLVVTELPISQGLCLQESEVSINSVLQGCTRVFDYSDTSFMGTGLSPSYITNASAPPRFWQAKISTTHPCPNPTLNLCLLDPIFQHEALESYTSHSKTRRCWECLPPSKHSSGALLRCL